jgi:hypothetical protein
MTPGTHLLPNAALPPFDAAAYVADPAPYLAAIVPSRQFQVGDDAAGGDLLVAASGASSEAVALPKSTGTDLVVRASPGWPVTFVAHDRGVFAHGAIAITVQAQADGLARARLFAPAGTTDLVRVVAASPVHPGTVAFTAEVQP